jgi:NAD(P)-dependent dehydrogenase (short-subunit alcohol dehydrogenase family)
VLQEAAKAIGSEAVIPLACDVTSKADLESAASTIQSQIGYVNLLVCNSGIGGPYGIRHSPSLSLDEYVAANLSVDST